MATQNKKEKNQMVINIEGFLGAAALPDRAGLLTQLQIGQALLDEGNELVSQWHDRSQLLDDAKLKRDDIIAAKQKTRKVAILEMTALIMFFRRQYYDDERLLRSLGLGTERRTVLIENDDNEDSQGNAPGNQNQEPKTRKVAVSRSERESERITLWRSMLACIPSLREDVRQRLEVVGFDQARLDQLKAAVEAFATTLPLVKVAVAERKERRRLLRLTERNLNKWLVLIRAMMKPRIRLIEDKDDQEFLALMAV